jgi:hypothetical protein
MSVSIGWKKKDPKKLDYISRGSSFYKVLENAFGGFPMELDYSHISVLRGIEACSFDGANELIAAISDNGCIVVDAEW